MRELKVFVIDDHPIFRFGVNDLLKAEAAFRVIGEAGDGQEALDKISALAPDVILLDIEMPLLDGPGFLRALKDKNVAAKVIAVSQSSEEHRLRELIEIGVDGHVLKTEDSTELLRALQAIKRGQTYFSPRIGECFLSLLKGRPATPSPLFLGGLNSQAQLSPREIDIARLIAEGYTNKLIAQALQSSEHTVKSHKANLMRKIGARNAAEVVAWSSRMGIIQ